MLRHSLPAVWKFSGALSSRLRDDHLLSTNVDHVMLEGGEP